MHDLVQRIAPHLADLTALRHALHANPEPAFEEHATAERILSELKRIPSLTIRAGVATTGIVATLGAGKPGPCVALRADMDALPMTEETGLPYASKRAGFAHACGHDGHVTCLVGAARVLAEMVDDLSGPVRFIFQPAEEGGGGGLLMCEQGALEDPPVAVAFALHGHPQLTVGQVGVRGGPVMASTDALNITVTGKGTHAASPHLGVDPVLAASQLVVALQTVVSRQLPPYEPAVVTIGSIAGGTARNVIPDRVELRGTIRTLSEQARMKAAAAVRQVARGTAAAHGATVDVDIVSGYPVLVNDPALADFTRATAGQELGSECLGEIPLSLGGEDFAYYAERVPAVMWRLGTGGPDAASTPTLHNPRYNFADGAIATGVRMHCALVFGYQASHTP